MIKEQQLELIGLSQKEARLYMAALPLGPFTVADISKKSGIKRPTCYIVLDELIRRGLVSVTPRAKKRLYKIESPEALIRQAKQTLNYAEKLVPSLRSMLKQGEEIPTMKFYYGQKGIQNIYEESLRPGNKIIHYIGSSGPQIEMAGEEFMRHFVEERVRRGIKSMSIRMRRTEVEADIFIGQKELLREIRYAPDDIFIPDTVYMFSNKIAFISTTKGNFGFMIESPELYQTILGLFQALWRISKV